jgi:hypothetical protein
MCRLSWNLRASTSWKPLGLSGLYWDYFTFIPILNWDSWILTDGRLLASSSTALPAITRKGITWMKSGASYQTEQLICKLMYINTMLYCTYLYFIINLCLYSDKISVEEQRRADVRYVVCKSKALRTMCKVKCNCSSSTELSPSLSFCSGTQDNRFPRTKLFQRIARVHP